MLNIIGVQRNWIWYGYSSPTSKNRHCPILWRVWPRTWCISRIPSQSVRVWWSHGCIQHYPWIRVMEGFKKWVMVYPRLVQGKENSMFMWAFIGHNFYFYQVFMNYSHNTPLYKMLRKVKKELEKRETEHGCKQGMMFQVSKYLDSWSWDDDLWKLWTRNDGTWTFLIHWNSGLWFWGWPLLQSRNSDWI